MSTNREDIIEQLREAKGILDTLDITKDPRNTCFERGYVEALCWVLDIDTENIEEVLAE